MIKMKKRIAIVVTAAAMAATAVTGCGGVNANAVVAEIGDDSMTMGVANFFARYKQALTEAQIGGYFRWISGTQRCQKTRHGKRTRRKIS